MNTKTESIEHRMRSWEPRPVSNRIRRQLFDRQRGDATRLMIPLTWCWVVPLMATILWLDLGPGGAGRSLTGAAESWASRSILDASNRWAAAYHPRDHSLQNWVKRGTFASTKMTVSPSTNPPPSRMAQYVAGQ